MHTPLRPLTLLLGNLPIQVRLALSRLLQAQPDVQLLGLGAEHNELPTLARRLQPDVVVVAENQLSVLEQLARQSQVPVLLYAGTALLRGVLQETARWGVYNYISPMPAVGSTAFVAWQQDVLHKIRTLRPKLVPTATLLPFIPAKRTVLPQGIVVIGASTGGVRAVELLVSGLKTRLNWTVVVALHLPAHFTASFVRRLRRAALLPVEAADAGTTLEAGKITVIPGACNMVVEAGFTGTWPFWKLNLTTELSPSFDEPSIDLLMCSAAQTAGAQVLGAVMTGLGHDGTLGAQAIRQHGGIVVVQDEVSSEVFSMPKSVIQGGWANEIIALNDLAAYINEHTAKMRPERRLRTPSSAYMASR